MYQQDKFEKERSFETAKLVTAVYNALAAGESVTKVQQDLVYKGIDEATAAYVVKRVYEKKRWQIAWQRAGESVRMLLGGLGGLVVAGLVLLLGSAAARYISIVYADFGHLLFVAVLFVSGLMAAASTLTLSIGGFRLVTASSDSANGCLHAILVTLIVLLAVLLFYLLGQILL